MSFETAWAGGQLNANSTAYQTAILSTELASIANGSSVMSTITFDNTVLGDQFMDVSFVGAYASAQTVQSGAGVSLYLAVLQNNNTTYGDGRLTAGSQATYLPILNSIGGIPIAPGTSITNIAGSLLNVTIPPRKFSLVLYNGAFATLASSGCNCAISTYRQNTNA